MLVMRVELICVAVSDVCCLTMSDNRRVLMCLQGPNVTFTAVIGVVFWFHSYSHESHSAHHYPVVTTTAITYSQ